MNLVPRVSGFKIAMKSCSVKRCKKKREKRARTGERQRQGHRPLSRVVRVLPVFLIRPTILSESLARARSAKIVRSRDPLTRIESRDRIAVSVKRPVEVWPQLFKMWITLSVIGFPNTYPLDGDLSGG